MKHYSRKRRRKQRRQLILRVTKTIGRYQSIKAWTTALTKSCLAERKNSPWNRYTHPVDLEHGLEARIQEECEFVVARWLFGFKTQ